MVNNQVINGYVDVARILTKKTAPEYPTAGTGVIVRVYSGRGKRLGSVFSSVKKAQDYLSQN